MPTFIGGPAHGETLRLARAPKLLRIAQNGPCFRALDTYGAEPDYTELLYVYRKDGPMSDDPAIAAAATYRLIPDQPKETRIFLTDAWCGFAREYLANNKKPLGP